MISSRIYCGECLYEHSRKIQCSLQPPFPNTVRFPPLLPLVFIHLRPKKSINVDLTLPRLSILLQHTRCATKNKHSFHNPHSTHMSRTPTRSSSETPTPSPPHSQARAEWENLLTQTQFATNRDLNNFIESDAIQNAFDEYLQDFLRTNRTSEEPKLWGRDDSHRNRRGSTSSTPPQQTVMV